MNQVAAPGELIVHVSFARFVFTESQSGVSVTPLRNKNRSASAESPVNVTLSEDMLAVVSMRYQINPSSPTVPLVATPALNVVAVGIVGAGGVGGGGGPPGPGFNHGANVGYA